MKNKKSFLISIALVCSTSVYAQFGGLLNQVQKELEKNLKQPTAPGNSSQNAPKVLGLGKPKVLTSEEFCNKLKSSEELNEFASYAKKLATQHNTSYSFDTKDKLVSNWIAGKLSPMMPTNGGNGVNDFILPSEAAANECALSIRDTDLLYLMADSQRDYEFLKSKLDKVAQAQTPQSVRKMDASGNIINETVKPKIQSISAIGDYSSHSSIVRTLGSSRFGEKSSTPNQWLVTWLVLLDENGQVLKNTYPEIKTLTSDTIAQLDNKKKEGDERWEKERKQSADAKAKEEREKQAEMDRYRNFVNSPDGKLTVSYQYYQVIQTCNEIRKGYANQFINDSELSGATKKIKAIESSVKTNLKDKNTDKLWANAIARNQKWNPTEGTMLFTPGIAVDLIDTIKTNNKSNWTASKNDCVHIYGRFNDFAEEILGKETPKKSF